jgi:hypothetical protein
MIEHHIISYNKVNEKLILPFLIVKNLINKLNQTINYSFKICSFEFNLNVNNFKNKKKYVITLKKIQE